MVSRQILRVFRRARAYCGRWSPARDRAYHDWLFGDQPVDPFRRSCPGNVTILRFADLTAAHLGAATHVLDLGCGPGEITCELARRYPGTRFEGIDHSHVGITRARAHAERLDLKNIAFRVADVERFAPDGPVDLIVMFDSFHHITDPGGFVSRMSRFSSRFLLIEPRGDWAERWSKEVDLDWLVHDLEKIRTRLRYATGESEPPSEPGSVGPPEVEDPVEHRYPPEDFERWFAGFGLEIRGTVGGLDGYPPSPELDTPTRERFGELAYELYKEADDLFRERDLGLFAKQLVIYAERGTRTVHRELAAAPPDREWAERIRGPYDARYLAYDGLREAGTEKELHATVTLRNEGWRPWSSVLEEGPDFVSYHWLDR